MLVSQIFRTFSWVTEAKVLYVSILFLSNSTKNQIQKVPFEVFVNTRYLHQDMGMTTRDIIKKYPQYSKSSTYRHANKSLGVVKEQKNKGCRPSKMIVRDQWVIKFYVYRLRESDRTFTSKRLQLESGITSISNRTFRYYLNKSGFRYLETQKKGLLPSSDLKNRLKFEKKKKKKKILAQIYGLMKYISTLMVLLFSTNLIQKIRLEFYMEKNGEKQVKDWRKIVLQKGAKVGSGGRGAQFIVAISVILLYVNNMNAWTRNILQNLF